MPDLIDEIPKSSDAAISDIALYEMVGNHKRRYSFGRFIRPALLMLIDALCNTCLIFYPDTIEGRNCAM